MSDIRSSASTPRFPTTPDQQRTRKSPMPTKRGTILSTDTTSLFPVRKGGNLIVFNDVLLTGSYKILIPKIRVGVRIRLATVSMEFEEFQQIFGCNRLPCERTRRYMDHYLTAISWRTVHLRAVHEVAHSLMRLFFCTVGLRLCCCDAFHVHRGFNA